ncbi:hypothetical protein EV360DRAFT_89370 [Lentinula raphanica]|nr:hypothetical protein EV360DRAFT_89370 [Lentinula raphanica]
MRLISIVVVAMISGLVSAMPVPLDDVIVVPRSVAGRGPRLSRRERPQSVGREDYQSRLFTQQLETAVQDPGPERATTPPGLPEGQQVTEPNPAIAPHPGASPAGRRGSETGSEAGSEAGSERSPTHFRSAPPLTVSHSQTSASAAPRLKIEFVPGADHASSEEIKDLTERTVKLGVLETGGYGGQYEFHFDNYYEGHTFTERQPLYFKMYDSRPHSRCGEPEGCVGTAGFAGDPPRYYGRLSQTSRRTRQSHTRPQMISLLKKLPLVDKLKKNAEIEESNTQIRLANSKKEDPTTWEDTASLITVTSQEFEGIRLSPTLFEKLKDWIPDYVLMNMERRNRTEVQGTK